MNKKFIYFFLFNIFTNILAEDVQKYKNSDENFLNDLNKISEENKKKEKEFLLPKTDNEVKDTETSLKNMSTSFESKKIKRYSPIIGGIHFCGIDSIDITRSVIGMFKEKFKKQITIDLVGIYWRYGIFCGVDGGLKFANVKINNDQNLKQIFPFINISFGFLLSAGKLFKISIGTCKYRSNKISPNNNIYPLWWTVTPICLNTILFNINKNFSLILRVEVLFKRLISIDFLNIRTNFKDRNKCDDEDIPFFGKTSAHNLKNTYFGIQVMIELLYTHKIERIDL